jgi:membrane protease YdiL (CAAX protease family)
LRIALFLLLLVTAWLPIALPINLLISDRNLATLLSLPILYGEFLLLVQGWNRWVYRQPHPLRRYGLRQPRRNFRNLLAGLLVGWIAVLGVFGSQWLGGAIHGVEPTTSFPRIVAEAWWMSLPLGFAEELLFRGWLLDELERDYSAPVALWSASAVFAIAHFLRPWSEILQTWLNFPALLILGLALGWAKRAGQGRLGLPIGLHAGLVGAYYVLNVGQLMQPMPGVPPWLTGMNGNPLASLPGVIGLGLIAAVMRWNSQAPRS